MVGSYPMKLLPIAIAALAGLMVGIFAGRTFAPPAEDRGRKTPAAQVSSAERSSEEQTGGEATGKSAGGTQSKPLTFDMLLSELTRMEAGSQSGAAALRARADLQERLKSSDLPTLVAALANSSVADRDRSLRLIFSTYAEEDPQAAWNLALAMQNPSMRRGALHAVMSSVGSINPDQALAMSEEIKDASLRRHLRSSALNSLAAKDPARAFAVAIQTGDREEFSIREVVGRWAAKDPQAAKAAVASLKGKQAEMAQMAIVSQLTRQDPLAAWDYAVQLPSPAGDRYWRDPRMQVIQEWVQSDPAGALGAALAIQDGERRGEIVASAISTWASADFSAALDYAVKIKDAGMRGRILQALAMNQDADRSKMFEVLMEHAPPGESFQQSMGVLMNHWARENPREAATAVMQLPPNRSLTYIAGHVADEWVSSGTDKMEIFNWVRSLPEGQMRKTTVNRLFGAWAKEDSAGALRALSSLGPDEKSEALQGIAAGWSRTAPADAAAWAKSLPSGDERNQAINRVVNTWARSSPPEAAAFVARLPEEGRERTQGTQGVVQTWASQDIASAAAWLQRQPAGQSKDAGLQVLSGQIAMEDPETALSWVKTISDPKMQTGQTEGILREWLRNDPASARKWIGTSPLPADLRQRLLQHK